jgi:hypothetical protein
MAMQTPPPPAKGMTPQQYYAALQQQGLSPYQAYTAVQANYGNPQDYINKQNAKQGQASAIGQTAGVLTGVLGVPYLIGQLGGGAAGTVGATTAGAGAVGAGATGAGTVATPTLVGATTTGGTTAGASTLGSVGSAALPVAVGAAVLSNAWETGMKDILRGRGTREDYTNQAVNMATGFVPNTALRLLGKRSIGKMMTTGKSDAQLQRDDFRGLLKQSGVADKNYHVTLADGSKFNVGLDGKTRYKNVGENIDGKTERQAWDVDFSNPLAKYATDQIDPMIRNVYGPDAEKAGIKPEQYTGMLVNAATSNAKSQQDVMNNIQAMLGKSTFAKEAGIAIPSAKPAVPSKGQVVRVSPGMYMNDKGHVGPANTLGQALKANYGKTK